MRGRHEQFDSGFAHRVGDLFDFQIEHGKPLLFSRLDTCKDNQRCFCFQMQARLRLVVKRTIQTTSVKINGWH